MSTRGRFGVLLLGLLATGCGGKTASVEGTVVFKDSQAPAKELAGYVVTLELEGGNVSATGMVQPDGTFRVSTYREGDGAVPGKHRVALTPPLPQGDRPIPPPILPPRYGDLKTSGLEIEVKKGQANPARLEVERLSPQ
jgi:hypothetical protein